MVPKLESDIEAEFPGYLFQIQEEHPEYGPVIEKIRFVTDRRKEITAWINPQYKLGWNPAFFKPLTPPQRKDVLKHEVLHAVHGHFKRFVLVGKVKNYIHTIANIAGDLEINSGLRNLPPGCLFPRMFNFPDGLVMEDYYSRLMEMASNGRKMPANSMANDVKDSYGESGNSFEVSDMDGFLHDEVEKEIEEAKKLWGTHTGGGKGETKIKLTEPIDILRWIKSFYQQLSQTEAYGFEGYNYNRFGRTLIPRIIDYKKTSYLPIIKVAFIVDTSGSRSNMDINGSLSKIVATLESVTDQHMLCDLFIVDTEVKQAIRINTRADVPKSFGGRGGTDLSPAYEAFKVRYNLVVLLTDAAMNWNRFDKIEEYYQRRTVIGIDAPSFDPTKEYKYPVFVVKR